MLPELLQFSCCPTVTLLKNVRNSVVLHWAVLIVFRCLFSKTALDARYQEKGALTTNRNITSIVLQSSIPETIRSCQAEMAHKICGKVSIRTNKELSIPISKTYLCFLQEKCDPLALRGLLSVAEHIICILKKKSNSPTNSCVVAVCLKKQHF